MYGDGDVVDAQYAGCCDGDSFEYCGEVTVADVYCRFEVVQGVLYVQFREGRHQQEAAFPFDLFLTSGRVKRIVAIIQVISGDRLVTSHNVPN